MTTALRTDLETSERLILLESELERLHEAYAAVKLELQSQRDQAREDRIEHDRTHQGEASRALAWRAAILATLVAIGSIAFNVAQFVFGWFW